MELQTLTWLILWFSVIGLIGCSYKVISEWRSYVPNKTKLGKFRIVIQDARRQV